MEIQPLSIRLIKPNFCLHISHRRSTTETRNPFATQREAPTLWSLQLCRMDFSGIKSVPMSHPLSRCSNDYYLFTIRSHASLKQLGQPVSISMMLKYPSSNHARKRQLRVKESKFELNCSSEAGSPGNYVDMVNSG